jgi:hypothetical protein
MAQKKPMAGWLSQPWQTTYFFFHEVQMARESQGQPSKAEPHSCTPSVNVNLISWTHPLLSLLLCARHLLALVTLLPSPIRLSISKGHRCQDTTVRWTKFLLYWPPILFLGLRSTCLLFRPALPRKVPPPSPHPLRNTRRGTAPCSTF